MIRNTRRRLAGRWRDIWAGCRRRARRYALYATLNAMLSLLHDSHTHALDAGPGGERRTQKRARTGFNMTRIDAGGW